MESFGYMISTRLAAEIATTLFVEGTVLVAIAWGLVAVLRSRSAATRYAVWIVTSAIREAQIGVAALDS